MGRSLYEILRRPVRPNSQRRQRDDDYQGVEVALGHAQCRTSLIVCPRCRASEFNLLEATCRSCGETYSAADGIIDFVGGRSDTALDVESYDQQKSVSFEKSVELFDALKRLAAGAIGDQVDTILEIGAGTGLLTLGMLNETEFERALITLCQFAAVVLQASRKKNGAGASSRLTAAAKIFLPSANLTSVLPIRCCTTSWNTREFSDHATTR